MLAGLTQFTNSAGLKHGSLTSSAGYTQIIDKRTHAVNSSVSCIDLIFCTIQNVISKHGLDISVFDKFHHDIIYGKINIWTCLTPIYVHKFWEYMNKNIENLRKQYLALIGIKLLKVSL